MCLVPGHASALALVLGVDLTPGTWHQARVGYRSYSRHMVSFERDSNITRAQVRYQEDSEGHELSAADPRGHSAKFA